VAIPGFQEWAEYCFTLGQEDFRRYSTDDEAESRSQRFHELDDRTTVEYLTRLFEAPEWIADKYTDQQIADGTWFIFGVGSDYLTSRTGVPPDDAVRCWRAISNLYVQLFDRVCGRRGTDPDAKLDLRVDTAVYMIWDMGHLELSAMFPENAPHLFEPAIQILETALFRCRTAACRQSALHGLGHVAGTHEGKDHPEVVARVLGMIDSFLQRTDVPAWLREYAEQARATSIQ
jgi:hypothetical protein